MEHSLKPYVLSELMHILLRANWVFEELIPSVLSNVVSTILGTYSFMWSFMVSRNLDVCSILKLMFTHIFHFVLSRL